jgi:hypothetical protein
MRGALKWLQSAVSYLSRDGGGGLPRRL